MNKLGQKRKSSGSSRRRKSGDKKSLTGSVKPDIQSTILEESLQEEESLPKEAEKPKINYQDEVVFIFFNSMLDYLIDQWITIPDTPICQCVDNKKDTNTISTIDSRFKEVESVIPEESTSSYKRKISKVSNLSKGGSFEHPSKLSLKLSNNIPLPKDVKNSSFTSRGEESIIPSSHSLDWTVQTPNENVIIKFKNGNRYEGPVSKRVMHGYGKFHWADGAIYEGDFVAGYGTGKGTLRYPDLSLYKGEFCKNRLHGRGVFTINSTSMIYSGEFKSSEKHGQGWLFYEPDSTYDGEWSEDHRHGSGICCYKTGEKYQGSWSEGKRHGQGTFLWANNDLYKGEWFYGDMQGYGEYTWNAFLNRSFIYPIQNIYRGTWTESKRDGVGVMNFGTDGGARLAGLWKENLKHGPGVMICDNGYILERNPLFWNDKPVHLLQSEEVLEKSYEGLSPNFMSLGSIISQNLIKSDFGHISNQVCSKRPSRSLDPHVLHNIAKFTNMDKDDHYYDTFPKTKECSPLLIPILTPPEQINLSHYIQLAVRKYVPELYKAEISSVKSGGDVCVTGNPSKYSKWNLCSDLVKASSVISHGSSTDISPEEVNKRLVYYQNLQSEVELKYVNHIILQYLPRLYQLYHKYATITCMEAVDMKVVLIRLFLWQMLRELPGFRKRYSLYELDKLLFDNSEIGLESEHNPFEEIYFWQFLQILLTLAWLTHTPVEVTAECKRFGIMSAILKNFITNYIEQNVEIASGCSLFAYKDVVPIHSVYLLYQSIGEPHTARTLLYNLCVKKGTEPPCHLRAFDDEVVPKLPKGINCIAVAGNLIYLPDDPPDFGEPPEEDLEFPHNDHFRKELYALRSLGPKKVVKCLTMVCPKIAEDGVVVNMEYPLSFIEFYDVLLMCTYMVVDKIKKKEERLRLLEEKRLLEEAMKMESTSKITINSSKMLKGGKRKSKKSL